MRKEQINNNNNSLDDNKSSSLDEISIRKQFFDHYKNNPLPDDQVLENIGLFLNTKNLSRILFMNFIYQKILDIQGVVIEFGTRWGQNISLFSALRGIYEPYNIQRKIIAFDTFEGFPSISSKDGEDNCIKTGNLNVTKNYENYLDVIMDFQEKDNPVSHIKKYVIRKGDAVIELKKYLEDNPQTIVSMVFFDLDLYEPTKICLQLIKPHLVKGSLLAFDQLCTDNFPGETIALKETFNLNEIKLHRYPFATRLSYFTL